jgi:hypothetical protein
MTTPLRKRPVPGAEDELGRPPWSRVRRVGLIRREIREYLPASTIELLLSAADHVFEGAGDQLGRGEAASRPASIYASLMATIDLAMAADAFREPADAATAQRVAELMEDHDAVREKLAVRARAALAERGAPDPDRLEISLQYEVRARGNEIFIDADVVASPSRRRRR